MARRPEWIPVNFSLPKDGQRCIVTRSAKNEDGDVVQYQPEWDVFYRGQGWLSSLGGGLGAVTHWMEAPMPPDLKEA